MVEQVGGLARGDITPFSLIHSVLCALTSRRLLYLPFLCPKVRVQRGRSLRAFWVPCVPHMLGGLAAAFCPELFLGCQYPNLQTAEMEQPS